MTEDDVIYHLGRIERMRKSIEQKIQTLTLDNADDAREGFRLIEEEADTLEKDRVQALMSIAEGASFEVVYPGRGYSSARSLGLDIDFEGALSTIQIEAEDICSTADEAAGVLEEMEGEEGDEVQGIVDDYLGTIDTSNDAIYKAVGEIKQGLAVGPDRSVNCYFCNRLVDERECVNADDYNNNDGGCACKSCAARLVKGLKEHRDATVPFFLRAGWRATKKKPSQGFLRSLERATKKKGRR